MKEAKRGLSEMSDLLVTGLLREVARPFSDAFTVGSLIVWAFSSDFRHDMPRQQRRGTTNEEGVAEEGRWSRSHRRKDLPRTTKSLQRNYRNDSVTDSDKDSSEMIAFAAASKKN